MMKELDKYTEELHIEGLKLLLSKEKPCARCPYKLIGKKLNMNFPMGKLFFPHHCHICRNFVEIDNDLYSSCPCYILKKEEAIKLTWIRLEEVLDENDPFLNDENWKP